MPRSWSLREARAVEQRGTQFDMRTNIKARPGSQGTLFQGGKPTAQHRWVRGYTPSRMAAVGGALMLGGGGMSVTADPQAMTHEYPGLSHPHLNPNSEEHTKRLMLEPLARSTYRVPDITNLAGGINLRVITGTPVGEAAHYNPSNRAINVNRQVHRGSPREQIAKADAVLMHEVGHHVDMTHNALQYDMEARRHPLGFEGQRGEREHDADANMIEHFRNDPRNQRQTKVDVRKLTYGGRGHAGSAGLGYTDPGAKTDAEHAASRSQLRMEAYAERGEPATPSPLQPGQFDRQLRMF